VRRIEDIRRGTTLKKYKNHKVKEIAKTAQNAMKSLEEHYLKKKQSPADYCPNKSSSTSRRALYA
jgi:hypothetical protein